LLLFLQAVTRKLINFLTGLDRIDLQGDWVTVLTLLNRAGMIAVFAFEVLAK
jgi:hypothetical protein